MKELEKNNIELKQKLLEESSLKILKETEMRNESELMAKRVSLERDLLENQVSQLQKQLQSLDEFKEKYAQKMEESMSKYKIDLNREHFEKISSVEIEKTKLAGSVYQLMQENAK
jgi:DNA-binding protein H-NS